MNLEYLKSLGFQLNGGNVDYKNVNYGRFTLSGAILTDAGRAKVEELEAGDPPPVTAEPKKPAAKKAAAKKAEPAADAAATPAGDNADLLSGLGSLVDD